MTDGRVKKLAWATIVLGNVGQEKAADHEQEGRPQDEDCGWLERCSGEA